MIEISRFNQLFMEVVKRKSFCIKFMDFVKKILLSLNSMVTIGMHSLIFFPIKMPNIHLASMMTRKNSFYHERNLRLRLSIFTVFTGQRLQC